MAKLYSNENFPLPVAKHLRDLGHDVLTIQEEGRADESLGDDQVPRRAIDQERAVLTHNRKDFMRLHKQDNDHAGIVVCTADNNFEALAKRIDEEVKAHDSLKGKLLRVNRPPKSS